MTRLIAVNHTENKAVVKSGNSFVWIDTEKVDVLKTERVLSLRANTEGWTREFASDTSAWFELAEAATTTLSVNERHLPSKRSIRIPQDVLANSTLFTEPSTTVDRVQELTVEDLEGQPDNLKAWAANIVDKFSNTVIDAGFVSDPENIYFTVSDPDDPMLVTGLFCFDPGSTWTEWTGKTWETAEEPVNDDLLVQLDEETAEELADYISDPENEGAPFELSSINPVEFGLFFAAESELDYEMLDRVFDVYDTYERSVNADKQVRGGNGRFTKNPSGGEPATRDNPVARLKINLPLLPDPAKAIDDYLKEVAAQRGEESAPPPDPRRKSFAAEEPAPAAPAEAPTPTTPEIQGTIKPMYLAVVDDIDPNAVLDLIALVPPAAGTGADVSSWKRSAGAWVAAPEYVGLLRGITPPPVIKLDDEAVLTDVLAQVDKATSEKTDEVAPPGQSETDAEGAPTDGVLPENPLPPRPVAASGHNLNLARYLYLNTAAPELNDQQLNYLTSRGYAFSDGSLLIRDVAELVQAVEEVETFEQQLHVAKRARALNRLDLVPSAWSNRQSMAIENSLFGPYGEVLGMAAAGGWDRNRGNAERLRRYWTKGPGAAKIGWAPNAGAWRRCVAYLSKYLGARAKGYCALRMKEVLGVWPGSKVNRGT